MLKKVGIFLGRQILKLGFFLGIKYEPLLDPPIIEICEWGPWDSCSMAYLFGWEIFIFLAFCLVLQSTLS